MPPQLLGVLRVYEVVVPRADVDAGGFQPTLINRHPYSGRRQFVPPRDGSC